MNLRSLFGGKNTDAPTSPAPDGPKPVAVTDGDFDEVVLGSGETPVLVDFWAPWCGPCRAMSPTMDQLAAELDGKALITKVNVDESPGIAQRYGIRGIPTLAIFKNGELVDRLVGVQQKAGLESRLLDLTD